MRRPPYHVPPPRPSPGFARHADPLGPEPITESKIQAVSPEVIGVEKRAMKRERHVQRKAGLFSGISAAGVIAVMTAAAPLVEKFWGTRVELEKRVASLEARMAAVRDGGTP